ncbi:hypothetical protein E2C01_075081 [Portunus trituberculatus]|uniref:Uncharacterized protein n=1 Tax=Portunus trituberculatus TaxID=210409 RepID=A0A5B7I557_PORTR|nr:hypothetical protein [Portunus trituberculatus]
MASITRLAAVRQLSLIYPINQAILLLKCAPHFPGDKVVTLQRLYLRPSPATSSHSLPSLLSLQQQPSFLSLQQVEKDCSLSSYKLQNKWTSPLTVPVLHNNVEGHDVPEDLHGPRVLTGELWWRLDWCTLIIGRLWCCQVRVDVKFKVWHCEGEQRMQV